MRALGALVLLLLCHLAAGANEAHRFRNADRVIAFGDVHGAFDELVSVLQKAGVIDDRLEWSAGATHVVSLGDLLDRGDHSRQVMDLLMSLQDEATGAGGRMHIVLGNHETMNLTGDLRYVTDREYAAFAGDEQPAERAAAKTVFAARFTDSVAAETAFSKAHPPGYFGHRAAFAPDGLYGRWLLGLPVMVQIDDTVYVHGGLPPLVAQLGLERVNAQLGQDLTEFVTLWHKLRDQRLVAFDQPADLAAIELAKLLQAQTPPALAATMQASVERFIELSESPVFSHRGPLWYRGSARCHPLLETDVIDAALDRLGARRVVVGHTPTRNRRVATRLDGKVVMIDSGMLVSYYNGTPAALVSDDGNTSVVYPALPAVHDAVRADHDNAADWPGDLADLEQFLRETAIVAQAGDARKQTAVVTLRAGDGREGQASLIGQRDARRELAAYSLDRLLGLGLVPVTVPRTLDGRAVALQLRRDDWIDEPARKARQLPLRDWCAAGDNFELMYVFDALTGNNRSDPATIRYSADRERLWLTGFSAAFTATRDWPRYMAGEIDTLQMSRETARRLAALDAGKLELELGGLLGKRERRALLQRRDAILATWKTRQP